MAKEISVVSQYPSKLQVQGENFDPKNLVMTTAADNGKKESNGAPKDTYPAFPGWYADVSWPGNYFFPSLVKKGSITYII